MKKPKTKSLKKTSSKKSSKPNRLEKATATYYASLSAKALKHENQLDAAIASASAKVNFDTD
jgi:hypothetical protein